MDKIKELFEKIKDGWKALEKNKKIALTIIVVGILLFVSIYTMISKKADYVTLYSDLTLEDAGKIVEDLDSKQIKYKLENGGTTILVDSKNIDRYRLDLAMDGNLPSETKGYEIFDDMGMMVTDDDRKIMLQRALEGELERSITSLDAIKRAKVHLVMSEKSIFETEEKDASASVILDIKPNYSLSEEALKGIGSLVSGAVENLPLENIQIVDSKGNLLSNMLADGSDNNSLNLLDKHQQIKADYEKKLEDNVLKLLAPVLGRNKVKVAINVDLDFDSKENETTRYSDPQPRSEQVEATGSDIETQQDDGLIGNTASNVINEVNGEDASYSHTRNNELTTEKTHTVSAPGKLLKVTASIVYDGNLSQQKIAEIENLVGTAIGYDFERDDLINVVGMEFDSDEKERLEGDLDEFNKSQGFLGLLEENKKYLLIGGLALVTLILLIVIVRKILGRDREDDLELDFENFDSKISEDTNIMEEVSREKPEETVIDISIDINESKANEYAEENPDLVADLIKVWMKED